MSDVRDLQELDEYGDEAYFDRRREGPRVFDSALLREPAVVLKGIFTERDVLFRIVDRGRNPATLPLKDVMTDDPERVKVSQPIGAVLHMMSVGGFRHIPVVDEEDRPVFVVSVKDVVQFLVDAFPREILNLADPAQRGTQRERDGA
jgi:CBS domain-containing protein